MDTTPTNHFDRGKPFYPLVVNYVAQLIGFKELALRGLTGPLTLEELTAKLPALGGEVVDTAAVEEVVDGLRKLSGPLELRSELQGDHITVDIDDVAREIAGNAGYLGESMLLAAGSLLILAHEHSKEAAWHDRGPLWEFLRHCRNAAAHNGVFTFRNAEPRRLATWGHFEIDSTLQGTRLFRGVENGLLSLGDPIRLLWDIEQAYPMMTL